MDLDAALRAHVRPGMRLHLTTQARAATRAVQRVFAGQPMEFDLLMGRIGGGHGADLVASGLVKSVVGGSYGAVSKGYTGPLPQVQKAFVSGQVRFSHWTFMTFTQRLMAAAQGLPFLPTRSLLGSSMARDNAPDYALLPDPSAPVGSGARIGTVSALHPDLSIVHVLACDEDGNAIMVPPLEDGAWGPKAAREGAIVTTEHVVSREFIRAHAHLVRLPARYVKAVCHVPCGAHPGPFGSHVLPELGQYAEDEAFNERYFKLARDPAALAQFVAEWITVPTHAQYLDKLGGARMDALKAAATERRSAAEIPAVAELARRVDAQRPVEPNEALMTLALREVLRLIAANGYDAMQMGAGLSEVPVTAAWTLLRERGAAPALIMGHGYYDFPPFPGHSEPDAASTRMICDAFDLYAVYFAGRPGGTLAVLGTAQVDRMGNANSTVVGGKLMVGSGGANDAASVCDTVIVTGLSRRKMVEAVEYITVPPARLRAVVTERGVFERDAAHGRLVLTRYYAAPGESREAVLADIAANLGWELEVARDLAAAAPPTAEELGAIRFLMPPRYQ